MTPVGFHATIPRYLHQGHGGLMDTIDVVIAGGGLAGSAAALTAARFGLRTVVLAPEGPMGALAVIEEIEGAPGFENVSGYDLCPTLHVQAAEAGAEIRPLGVEALSSSGNRWLVSVGGDTIEAKRPLWPQPAQPRQSSASRARRSSPVVGSAIAQAVMAPSSGD